MVALINMDNHPLGTTADLKMKTCALFLQSYITQILLYDIVPCSALKKD